MLIYRFFPTLSLPFINSLDLTKGCLGRLSHGAENPHFSGPPGLIPTIKEDLSNVFVRVGFVIQMFDIFCNKFVHLASVF